MEDGSNLPLDGGCRCGALRFRVEVAPLMTAACHCRGCQRMTGSAFSLTAMVAAEGFSVTRGEPVLGGLKGGTWHQFCPECLSWLFTRPEGVEAFVNVRATLFDDPDWFEPFIETCTAERLPWAMTPARHSFAGFPPPEEYDAMIAAFAVTGARP